MGGVGRNGSGKQSRSEFGDRSFLPPFLGEFLETRFVPVRNVKNTRRS